jgi:hypothetical protein
MLRILVNRSSRLCLAGRSSEDHDPRVRKLEIMRMFIDFHDSGGCCGL